MRINLLTNAGNMITEYSYLSDDRYIYFDVEHWFVQDFTLMLGGLEITIVKSEIELD